MEPVRLFGRDQEMETLGALFTDVRPIAVAGEAGIGKTTLVRVAAEVAGLRLREGGALATLTWTPFFALQRAVGDGFAGDPTLVATEVERRVGPDILFIDDLQWADEGTRDVVSLLAGRVAIVATIRTGDADGLAATELIRTSGGEVIELAGLAPDASAAVVRNARPTLDPVTVDRVVAQASGNALLLEELATRGSPTSSLRRALTTRLDELGPAARRSFALLALADRPLPSSALGRAAKELVRSRLVIEVDGESAIRHALFAEAAIAALSEPERRRLHSRLAGLVTMPGERARHLAGAGRKADAAVMARRAADSALNDLERAGHLELAAQMTDGPSADAARMESSRILVGHGGSGSARAIALLTAITDGPAELMVERDALLARAHWEAGDLVETRAAYVRGRSRPIVPTSPARARLDADEVSFVVNVDGDYETAQRILSEAMAAGRTTPRISGLDAAIRSLHDGVDTLEQSVEAYEAASADRGDPFVAFRNARNVAFVASEHRGYDLALERVEAAVERFTSWALMGRADDLRAEAIQVLLFAGRLEELVLRSDELLERALGSRARQLIVVTRATALAYQDRTDEAREALSAIEGVVTDDWEGRGELLAARIETEVAAGRNVQALAAYEAFRVIPCPSPTNAMMSDLAVRWALLELGRDPGPPYAPQPWRLMAGALGESKGQAALHDGDPAAAARHFEAAARAWVGFHRPRELVCRWAQGEALRRAGSPRSESILRDALESADGSGFVGLAIRSRRSLRQAGSYVRPVRPHATRDPMARLTGREREALELVGRGLATPEIARRMGLGRGTVDQILGAATRKLGAVSRVQAAVILQRDGPSGRPTTATRVVRDEADARTAILAAAIEGAEVAIDASADAGLADRVQGDLRRLGREAAVRVAHPEAVALGADELHLLARIAEGMTLGEAATSLHLSRRTADRRLRAARRALGVETTAEAVVAFQRRGMPLPE